MGATGAASTARVPNESASGGRGPRHIALVDLHPGSPASLLLDDFAEAFAVYERLSAQTFGEEIGAVCERFPLERNAEQDGRRCDAAILAAALNAEENAPGPRPDRAAADAQDALAKLPVRTPIYVLATVNDADVQPGREFLARLEEACREAGLTWMGSLLVADARLVAAVQRTARMGVWRRRTSEAVDELIAHVRMGQHAGATEIAHPVPRLLRPLARLIYVHAARP